MADTKLQERIARARDAGRETLTTAPRAKEVTYIPDGAQLLIRLLAGPELRVPIDQVQGLAGAPVDSVQNFELTPDGLGLHWKDLDVHHTVPGLVEGLYGTRRWMKAIGRKGGQARTTKKAHAARSNGLSGGRPVAAHPSAWTAPGVIGLERNGHGNYSAVLRAKNGRTLLETPASTNESEALERAKRLKVLVASDTVVIEREAQHGGIVLRFRSPEGQLLAVSRCYSTRSAASRARRTILDVVRQASDV